MAYVERGVVKSKPSFWRLKTITDFFSMIINFIQVFFLTMFSMEKSDAYKKGSGSSKKWGGGGPGGGRGPYGGGPGGPSRGLDNVRGLNDIRNANHRGRLSESSRVFTIVNKCKETIWPAITPGDSFGGGGFKLQAGQSRVFTAPVGWSGRIWGRTGCNFDGSGNGTCLTGRCGTDLQCKASGEPPATLAEFTLGTTTMDFYDVSLVDGFNVPVTVAPIKGQGNCTAAGCVSDLRKSCPSELQLRAGGETVACRSACDVFNTDQYCCRGAYGGPVVCQPTDYSKKFKNACPTAYSYAYDDPTSIFTCAAPDYAITFCSSREKVCSYHDNKLACSASDGLRSLLGTGSYLAIALYFSLLYVIN